MKKDDMMLMLISKEKKVAECGGKQMCSVVAVM